MVREFKTLVDIYSNPDKQGKSKILKRNVVKRKTINLQDVTSIEELINTKGKVLNNVCLIEVGDKAIIVKKKYSEIYEMISQVKGTSKQIGFKYKNRIL